MFPSDTTFNIEQTSRTHLIVTRRREITFVVNKSGNGTFVDGEMLERNEERIIRNGAKIAILRHDLELF